MENNAETLSSVGNGGGISQLGKAVAPDLRAAGRKGGMARAASIRAAKSQTPVGS